jgi:hypothetical protein
MDYVFQTALSDTRNGTGVVPSDAPGRCIIGSTGVTRGYCVLVVDRCKEHIWFEPLVTTGEWWVGL